MGSMSNTMNNSVNLAGTEKAKSKSVIVPILVVVIVILLLILVPLIYNTLIQPARYERYLDAGLLLLDDMQYEEAIDELIKAKDIDNSDYRAAVALAKAYSGLGDADKAIEYAWLARELNPSDEDMLFEILEIVEPLDPLSAFFILQDYYDSFESDNHSNRVRGRLDDMIALPELPSINLEGGRYLKPVIIVIDTRAVKYGHSIFYTLDGNIPTRRSSKYTGDILISESTLLQYVAYNPHGFTSDSAYLYFEINYEMLGRFENLINQSRDAYENTMVGVEVGNCIEGSKEMLGPVLEQAEMVYAKDVVTYEEAEDIYGELNNMLYIFKQRIIVPTDRRLLTESVGEARELHSRAVEGTTVGLYIQGSKLILQMSIDDAVMTLDNLIARQDDIDLAIANLRVAIDAFIASEIRVDNTRLNSTVVEATNLLSTAVEGNNVGNYRVGSKARLQNAINAANVILNNLMSTQDEVDRALEELNRAVQDFRASIVTQDDRRVIDEGGRFGRVTVSLYWSSTDDLDLHVTSPRGDTVYYGNPYSSSGGRLDIDQQISAPFVSNPIENIYWENPPSGTFTVVVNVFTKRSSGSIPARVRVIVDGVATEYSISISSGSTTVCTFRY